MLLFLLRSSIFFPPAGLPELKILFNSSACATAQCVQHLLFCFGIILYNVISKNHNERKVIFKYTNMIHLNNNKCRDLNLYKNKNLQQCPIFAKKKSRKNASMLERTKLAENS